MDKKPSWLRWAYRSLGRPPGRIHLSLALLWFLLACLYSSNAATEFRRVFVVAYLGLLIGSFWLLRFLVYSFSRSAKRRSTSWKRSLQWIVIPALALAWGGLSFSGQLFELRLRASEDSIRSYVQSIRPGTHEKYETAHKKVGWFWVSEVQEVGGSVRLITCHPVLHDAGLVFSPGHSPPVVGEDSYQHLYGPWWKWVRKW